MRVVLYEAVTGLGGRGDIVDVSDGYARNSLIPKGIAHMASPGAEAQAQKMKRSWEQKDLKNREIAEDAAKALVANTIHVSARAGKGGKLFGSITTADIAEAISSQTSVEIDKKMVEVSDSIRSTGDYSVVVKPHPEVQFPVNIVVEAE